MWQILVSDMLYTDGFSAYVDVFPWQFWFLSRLNVCHPGHIYLEFYSYSLILPFSRLTWPLYQPLSFFKCPAKNTLFFLFRVDFNSFGPYSLLSGKTEIFLKGISSSTQKSVYDDIKSTCWLISVPGSTRASHEGSSMLFFDQTYVSLFE